MKNLLLPFIFVFLLFASCKKTEINQFHIQMGILENMTLQVHNVEIVGRYQYPPDIYEIDLDQDGINDVQFECGRGGSISSSNQAWTYFRCLHEDILVKEEVGSDSLFITYDISYHLEPNNVILAISHTFRTCFRTAPSSSFYGLSPSNNLSVLDDYGLLSENDNFICDSVKMGSEPYSTMYIPISQTADSIFVAQHHFDLSCGFPMDDSKYIGFKFKNSNKLGWIKIKMSGSAKLLIKESAILN